MATTTRKLSDFAIYGPYVGGRDGLGGVVSYFAEISDPDNPNEIICRVSGSDRSKTMKKARKARRKIAGCWNK